MTFHGEVDIASCLELASVCLIPLALVISFFGYKHLKLVSCACAFLSIVHLASTSGLFLGLTITQLVAFVKFLAMCALFLTWLCPNVVMCSVGAAAVHVYIDQLWCDRIATPIFVVADLCGMVIGCTFVLTHGKPAFVACSSFYGAWLLVQVDCHLLHLCRAISSSDATVLFACHAIVACVAQYIQLAYTAQGIDHAAICPADRTTGDESTSQGEMGIE
ncbi:Aste57867_19080 [Aphanomyces stellatus]|uniref:Aste57867_19080 protein n=1 Tax=Aphanomyces stellatus TaxID=120398 RepID=A0A485LDE8_9STRA|nr:hypothetical protein As57867_019016 [Aphanomyces stellatus]VFT95805.1 Aste57867_19080 [Aphanomyces stellatus]